MKDFIKAVLLVIGFLILISCVAKGDDFKIYDWNTGDNVLRSSYENRNKM